MTAPAPLSSLPAAPLFSTPWSGVPQGRAEAVDTSAVQWNLGMDKAGIKASALWDEYSGAGVRVAVIDDGFDYTQSALSRAYNTTLDRDLLANDADPRAEAGNHHGTAVLGMIVAQNNGSGMRGVAQGAEAFGVRIGFSDLWNTTTNTAAVSYAASIGDVVNMSWGAQGAFSDNYASTWWAPMQAAIDTGVTQGRGGLGALFVTSAGNSREAGDNTNHHSFKNDEGTITVAATDANGQVAAFSTPGASILVAAPGASVLSTDVAGAGGYVAGDRALVSGTSFAAPTVSGVIALMLEANPALGYRDVQEILALTATRTATNTTWKDNGATTWNGGGMHTSPDLGFGLVDARAAVRLAEAWEATQTHANRLAVSATSSAKQALVDAGTLVSSLTIPATDALDHVETVQVVLNISHARASDLTITLTSPKGTVVTLIARPEQGTSAAGIVFETSATAFRGEQENGTWDLRVLDHVSGTTGTLNGWTLKLYGDAPTTDTLYTFTDSYAQVWSAARATLQDTNGGTDTLMLASLSGAASIDLNPGSAGSIAGKAFSIAAGTTIERAFLGEGNDRAIGNAAHNLLHGGRGADTLAGGAGNDTLIGGRGADLLEGGAGADTFRFAHALDAGDTITDLRPEEGDRLDIAPLLAALGWAGSVADAVGARCVALQAYASGATLLLSLPGKAVLALANLEGVAATTPLGLLLGLPGYAPGAPAPTGPTLTLSEEQATGWVKGATWGTSGAVYQIIDLTAALRSVALDLTTGRLTLAGKPAQAAQGLLATDIIGGTVADTLTGNALHNAIDGRAGNDVLRGAGGNDTLHGDAGNDRLQGDEGEDALYGGVGDDQLSGGAGHDRLFGEMGKDRLSGDAGNDTLAGGDDNDTLSGGDGEDSLRGDRGADKLSGDKGHDTLDGGEGNDTLDGGLGEDSLLGGEGADQISGGDGQDTLIGGAGADTLTGGKGADLFVLAADGGDTITDYRPGEGDRLDLTAALAAAGYTGTTPQADGWIDVRPASAAAEVWLTAPGQPAVLLATLTGHSAFNPHLLSGSTSADTLYVLHDGALAGFTATAPLAMADLDGGTDTIQAHAATGSMVLDLNANKLSSLAGGTLRLSSATIEHASAGAGADRLTGNALANRLEGNAGADTIEGGAGNDTLNGGTGDDVLTGGAGADTFVVGQGLDTLLDFKTNEGDRLDITAALGATTLDEALAQGRLTLRQDTTGSWLVYTPASGRATDLVRIEGLSGATPLPALFSGARTPALPMIVEAATKTLTASGEASATPWGVLEATGWAGGLVRAAGTAIDLSAFAAPVSLALGKTGTLDRKVLGFMGEVERLRLGAGQDKITGAARAEYIDGGAGNDAITGGDGNDTLHGGDGADRLSGGNGEDALYGGTGADILNGDAGHDLLVGGEGSDALTGSAGNDTLIGGSGIDMLTGGAGADTFVFHAQADAGDTLTDYKRTEGDRLDLAPLLATLGYTGTQPQADGWLDLRQNGTAAEVWLTAPGSTPFLVVRINGAIAFDAALLSGPASPNTTYAISPTGLASATASRPFVLGDKDGGIDTIDASAHSQAVSISLNSNTSSSLGGGWLRLSGATIEHATGGAGHDTLVGNALANRLEGGSGNDTLTGGTGADTFVLGEGTDTIRDFKGTEADRIDLTAFLATQGTTLEAALAGQRLTLRQEGAGSWLSYGTTALAYLDGLSGASAVGTLFSGLRSTPVPMQTAPSAGGGQSVGGGQAPAWKGGLFTPTKDGLYDLSSLPGAAVLTLGAGTKAGTVGGKAAGFSKDVLGLKLGQGHDRVTGDATSERLEGNGGNDTLGGGAGNDTLTGGAGADHLSGGTGQDRLYGGLDADKLWGEAGNDRLYGEAGNDQIWGGLGEDLLEGGAGNDRLSGDAGHDTLRGGDGADALYGGAGNDWLYGDAAHDALFGEAGHDRLWGGTGNDTLAGGDGHDTLTGGAGTDALTGGLGADVFVFGPRDGSIDTITDFSRRQGDRIDLDGWAQSLGHRDAHAALRAGDIRLDAHGRHSWLSVQDDDGTWVRTAHLDGVAHTTTLDAGWFV